MDTIDSDNATQGSQAHCTLTTSDIWVPRSINERVVKTNISSRNRPLTSQQSRRETHRHSKPQSAREHLLDFCQTTTLRGFVHISNKSKGKLRWLWLAFILVLYVACFWWIVLLVKEYILFTTVHISQKSDKKVDFPSFTLCSTKRITNKGIKIIKDNNLAMMNAYTDNIIYHIMSYIRAANIRRNYRLKRELHMRYSPLLNIPTYLRNLPQKLDRQSLGTNLDNFLLKCKVFNSDIRVRTDIGDDWKIESDEHDCSTRGTFSRFEDPSFGNCYTYSLRPEHRLATKEMELLVYLDEAELTKCDSCMKFEFQSQIPGARFVIHPPETVTYPDEEGITFNPGSLNVINVEATEWNMQKPPFGVCSNTVKPLSLNNRTFGYTEKTCRKLHIQAAVASACNCRSAEFYQRTDVWLANMSYCDEIYDLLRVQPADVSPKYASVDYNGTEFLDDHYRFMRKVKCWQDMVAKFARAATFPSCKRPCQYYTYEPHISSTQWPIKSYQTEFIKDVLNECNNAEVNRTIYQQTAGYRKVEELVLLSKMNEAYNKLSELEFVERNFVSIKIVRSKEVTVVHEKTKFTLTALLCRVGGLLSIFVGVTLIIIVELLDKLCQIACACY